MSSRDRKESGNNLQHTLINKRSQSEGCRGTPLCDTVEKEGCGDSGNVSADRKAGQPQKIWFGVFFEKGLRLALNSQTLLSLQSSAVSSLEDLRQ